MKQRTKHSTSIAKLVSITSLVSEFTQQNDET